jgi:hypothetical protein
MNSANPNNVSGTEQVGASHGMNPTSGSPSTDIQTEVRKSALLPLDKMHGAGWRSTSSEPSELMRVRQVRMASREGYEPRGRQGRLQSDTCWHDWPSACLGISLSDVFTVIVSRTSNIDGWRNSGSHASHNQTEKMKQLGHQHIWGTSLFMMDTHTNKVSKPNIPAESPHFAHENSLPLRTPTRSRKSFSPMNKRDITETVLFRKMTD